MAKRPVPIGMLVHELQVRLHAIGRAGRRSADTTMFAKMHDAGVTLPQVVTLTHLRHEGAAAIKALAQLLGMSMSATSALVQRLVEAELVSRSEDPTDRRQRKIEISRTGAALIDRLTVQRSAELGHGVASLPPPLRSELLDVLGRVADHLRQRTREAP